jgi:hypothetical protein
MEYLEGTKMVILTASTTFTISNETAFAPPCKEEIERGPFDSQGVVYVYLYSPYANDWTTFNIWMSLDNSSWTPVPFLNFITQNHSQMADLGIISFSNPLN